jgi:hypothetical protein
VKTNFRKSLDSYHARGDEVRLLEVPPLQYLMIDGHGDPNTSPEYAEALRVLYPFAFALKFASKEDLGRDYVVPPLEGLWWAEDMAAFTTSRNKSAWNWTVMLMTPSWLRAEHLTAARDTVASKKPSVPLERVRVEVLEEGLCVQTLHVGSFEDEGLVLADLHEHFIPQHGLVMTGRHHEIYLSDPRRTAPSNLKTILRQPVQLARPGLA